MKALLFGSLLGLAVLLWPATLPLAAVTLPAETLAALAGQPAVLAFVLGILARPTLARRTS
jgi:hypothetical protein